MKSHDHGIVYSNFSLLSVIVTGFCNIFRLIHQLLPLLLKRFVAHVRHYNISILFLMDPDFETKELRVLLFDIDDPGFFIGNLQFQPLLQPLCYCGFNSFSVLTTPTENPKIIRIPDNIHFFELCLMHNLISITAVNSPIWINFSFSLFNDRII